MSPRRLRAPVLPAAARRALRAAARVACAALLLVGPARAGAQDDLRTLESSRQLRDSSSLAVRIRYGAGRLVLRPTREPLLYDAELRYDPERSTPVLRYDSIGRRLEIGTALEGQQVSRGRQSGSLRLALTTRAPLALEVDLGAASAELDLGGLALETLRLASGASETRVRFDSLAVRPLRRLDVSAGAATLRIDGLGNARVPFVKVDAGVGDVALDFGDRWTTDTEIEASVAMGSLLLRVPQGVAVRVTMDRFLAGFDHGDELRRRDGGWESPDWATAERRLRVRASAAFGKLRLERR